MRNCRGSAELFLTIFLVLVLGVVIGAIFSKPQHKHHIKTVAALVKKLAPVCTKDACTGRYALQDEDDWWIYSFAMDSSASSSAAPYTAYGNTLPSSGSWAKGSAPKENEVETEADVAVNEDEEGDPTTEAANESDTSTSDTAAASEASDSSSSGGSSSTSSAATSDTSSSSSSSSDSGSSGGGDGGGDGGGGGGGD